MAKKKSGEVKKSNKRGAEMTIGTIIVIILALVVLVVLIYGFTTGWGNLFQKLLGYGGGQVNVQTVVDGCKLSCSTVSTYDYCEKSQKVIFDTNTSAAKNGASLTCLQLENYAVGLGSCAGINCGSVGNPGKSCNSWSGSWSPNKCVDATQTDITNNKLLAASDKASFPNQNCCVPKLTSCSGTWVLKTRGCDAGYYDITQLISPIPQANTDSVCCVQ